MLPRVEGALFAHFLSYSLLPPRSHSHRLLSSARPGSTRNTGDAADPRNRNAWCDGASLVHHLSGHLVKPRLSDRLDVSPSQTSKHSTLCHLGLGRGLGWGTIKSGLAR